MQEFAQKNGPLLLTNTNCFSRMIIERHQGSVGVESAPGQGSTFWFTLPLAEQTLVKPAGGD